MLANLRKHALGEVAAPPKEKAPTDYRESKEQRDVVAWIRKRPDWLVMRMENAAKRNGARYQRDAAMGMEPGAPDLIVFFHHFGFFLEMKETKGKVSDVQAKLHNQLKLRGSEVMIGWGAQRTITAFEKMEVYWSHYNEGERHNAMCIGGLRGIMQRASVK